MFTVTQKMEQVWNKSFHIFFSFIVKLCFLKNYSKYYLYNLVCILGHKILFLSVYILCYYLNELEFNDI